jgi:hypothetical protein
VLRCLGTTALIAAIAAGPIHVSVFAAPPRSVDDDRASAAGIHKFTSRHLVLYTDVPPNVEIERLPELFDQAVPQWAAFFGVDSAKAASFRAQGYLIADRTRFDALGLMPATHDDFVNGISFGSELWLHDQPTAYYRRHLLLHEGTHVFMATMLGGCGPGWYMEGTAELLATHRLDEATGHLTLNIMPRNRHEVPMLGRIKLIGEAFDAGQALPLAAVMQIDNRRQLGNDAYAWCWAAAKFLDSHPRYRDRFRKLKNHVLDSDFNRIVRHEYQRDWEDLATEWQAFAATLDYDYDFERMAIDFQTDQPLTSSARTVTIRADRGWQSSGVRLEAGGSYQITASGRYQIAAEEANGVMQAWPCEPGGVTIEYHDGKPLGVLLGAIDGRDAGGAGAKATFAEPIVIGLGAAITPAADGTLYLRVNDSAGRLDDNRETLTVRIEQSD